MKTIQSNLEQFTANILSCESQNNIKGGGIVSGSLGVVEDLGD